VIRAAGREEKSGKGISVGPCSAMAIGLPGRCWSPVGCSRSWCAMPPIAKENPTLWWGFVGS